MEKDRVTRALESICGLPVYKAVRIDKQGTVVCLPFYQIPEKWIKRK